MQTIVHKMDKQGPTTWYYHIIAFISHVSKAVLKIFQARTSAVCELRLSDVKAGFRKGRGTRDQIATIHWIIEKTTGLQKNTDLCFIDYTVWITRNCEKLLKDGSPRPPNLSPEKPACSSRSHS